MESDLSALLDEGAAYRLDDGSADVYFDVSAAPRFGYESHLTREQMIAFFAEREKHARELGGYSHACFCAVQRAEHDILATMACHAAVKAGDPLDEEEIAALLEQGASLEHDATCPHGRPTMIHLSVDTLERQFGRRGAR